MKGDSEHYTDIFLQHDVKQQHPARDSQITYMIHSDGLIHYMYTCWWEANLYVIGKQRRIYSLTIELRCVCLVVVFIFFRWGGGCCCCFCGWRGSVSLISWKQELIKNNGNWVVGQSGSKVQNTGNYHDSFENFSISLKI